MPPKKKAGKAPAVTLKPGEKPPEPRKPLPPPKSFTADDLAMYKSVFMEFDETHQMKCMLEDVPIIMRRLGLNPSQAQCKELYATFLEDDLVDTVEYWEFLYMLERKMQWGDDNEMVIVKAFAALGGYSEFGGGVEFDERQPESLTLYASVEKIMDELTKWGEPLKAEEVNELPVAIKKERLLTPTPGPEGEERYSFQFFKFVDKMNKKDRRFFAEPVNFWKLDQKELLKMAVEKAAEEAAREQERLAKEQAKEEARRKKLIEEGLLQPD